MVLAVFSLAVVSPGALAQQKNTKVKVEQKQKIENKGIEHKKVDTLDQQQKKTGVGKEQGKNTEVTEKTGQTGKGDTVEIGDKSGKSGKKEKIGQDDKSGDTVKAPGKDKRIKTRGNAYGRNKGDLEGREFGQQRAADAKAKKSSVQDETGTNSKDKKEIRKKNR